MENIRIVYVVSTLARTGPTKQLYNIVKYLDKSIFDVSVVTLSPEGDHTYWADFSRLDIPLYSLKQSRLMGVFTTVPTLKNLFSLINPDIIHTQGIRSDVISQFFQRYRLRYSTQRNDPGVDYPLQYGRILGNFLARLHNQVLKKIPYVIACSETISKINKEKNIDSFYIHNGVDLKRGQKLLTRTKKIDIRKKLNLNTRGLLFVLIGPVIKRKDIDVAVRAMVDHLPNFPGSLCILGSGPYLDDCKAAAKGRPNIIFRGFVENIERYLMAADGLLSASRSEGIPNGVLEALAWGLPVIISDIPAHREILRFDPRAGYFFCLGDSVDLARAIQHFNPDPTTCLAAQRIAQRNFDAELMAGNYQKSYLKTLNQLNTSSAPSIN